MARTKADAYQKAAVKAPRKVSVLTGAQNSPKSGNKASKHSGGNPYCPRPTPSWQKPITTFFSKDGGSSKEENKDKNQEENLDVEMSEEGACDISTESQDPDTAGPSCSMPELSDDDDDPKNMHVSSGMAAEDVPSDTAAEDVPSDTTQGDVPSDMAVEDDVPSNKTSEDEGVDVSEDKDN